MTTPEQRAKNAEYMRRWHAANPRKIKGYNLKRYGMTVDEFEALLVKQGNQCAVCRREFEDNNAMRANVDHDHDTGRVRGLVCPRCNAILGRVNRDIELLLAAVEYLRAA